MLFSYLKLSSAACMPVIAAVIFQLLSGCAFVKRMSYAVKQTIIGVVFGGLAVIGTEWGIPVTDVVLNCRDAAPLCAGLFFGGPAGIIAGVIGGVERWLAVYWGAGTLTRVACSVSTVFAGVFAAVLRKTMFDDKRPGWLIAFAIGVVMEVFHLTMVFVTNGEDPDRVVYIVKECLPMILFCGVSVLLTGVCMTLMSDGFKKQSGKHIADTVQHTLLICVIVSICITEVFNFVLGNIQCTNQSDKVLKSSIESVELDIVKASDVSMLETATTIANTLDISTLTGLKRRFGVAEIHVIDKNGVITKSTNKDYTGVNINDYTESEQLMPLAAGEQQTFLQTRGTDDEYRKYVGIATQSGCVLVSFNAEYVMGNISEMLYGITENRRVGETGCILIADKDGVIISAPENFESTNLSQLEFYYKNADMEPFYAEYNEVYYICMTDSVEQYTIMSMYPYSEATSYRDMSLLITAFMEVLVFALLFGVIYIMLKRSVLLNLKQVNESLSLITQGDMDVRVNVRSNDEFSSLSDDINSTVDTLKKYIADAASRIDKELEVAKNIQLSSLPNVFPAYPQHKEFDIFAQMRPAKEVGGDFYDFYMTDDHTLYFLVADVSGKGIPAAMFMMRAKTELKNLTESGLELKEVFEACNNNLCDGNDAEMFLTCWMGRLDINTGILKYVNAGHNQPLLKHIDGSYEFFKTKSNFILAGMEDMIYKEHEIQLQEGDRLFLYTDGATEAVNIKEELYGDERLMNVLNEMNANNSKELCTNVQTSIDSFAGEAAQFDDITMVALGYKNTEVTVERRYESATFDDIPDVTDFICDELDKLRCSAKMSTQISIVIDEVYSNIVKFAYPEHPSLVIVRFHTDGLENVNITFIDKGPQYNPLLREDPDTNLNAQQREIGGLGIFVVKKTMDKVDYEYKDNQNILTITKRIS